MIEGNPKYPLAYISRKSVALVIVKSFTSLYGLKKIRDFHVV